MTNWTNEAEAREQIKGMVAEYYNQFKKETKAFEPGDRISYASRVYDEKEMCTLTDAVLDFWLTTGRFSDQFEKEFAEYCDAEHCVGVATGLDAIYLILKAMNIGEGD